MIFATQILSTCRKQNFNVQFHNSIFFFLDMLPEGIILALLYHILQKQIWELFLKMCLVKALEIVRDI